MAIRLVMKKAEQYFGNNEEMKNITNFDDADPESDFDQAFLEVDELDQELINYSTRTSTANQIFGLEPSDQLSDEDMNYSQFAMSIDDANSKAPKENNIDIQSKDDEEIFQVTPINPKKGPPVIDVDHDKPRKNPLIKQIEEELTLRNRMKRGGGPFWGKKERECPAVYDVDQNCIKLGEQNAAFFESKRKLKKGLESNNLHQMASIEQFQIVQ